MGSRIVSAVCLIAMVAVFAACGESQKVGSEKLLEFDEQGPGQRLGGRTAAPIKGTPKPLTVDTPKPTAKPVSTTPKPEATPSYFDLSLVADSPYYRPGNYTTIKAGVTIRVTNNDMTNERAKGRSYTDKSGSFHSGLIKPGAKWEWTFNSPGVYEIVDEGLTFATGRLEVIP